MAYEPVHPVNLKDSEGYDPGVAKNLSAGMTESSRFIMKKQLDRNYKLTKIKFDLKSGKFITSLLPAVIRVYQKDFETDAKYLIISGNAYVQANYEEDIDLNITDREATREVVVDS